MAFVKITNEDLLNKGVRGLPDTPNLSTSDMQAKFDEIATDVLVPKHNGLIDELEASTSAASIGAKDSASADSTVQAELDDRYTKDAADDLLDTKVDKIEGKGLSANDYTDEEKTKLAGIEEGANNYELPQANTTTLGGIKPDNETITVDENGVAHSFGSGGSANYEGLLNKPQINGITLVDNLSTSDLRINDGGFFSNPVSLSVGDTTATFTDDDYSDDWIYGAPVADDGTGKPIPWDSIVVNASNQAVLTFKLPLANATVVRLHYWR